MLEKVIPRWSKLLNQIHKSTQVLQVDVAQYEGGHWTEAFKEIAINSL
jgi:hypothetical protein